MKIGIIGFGNLGKALTNGLLQTELVQKQDIFVCAKTATSIEDAKSNFGVQASFDINEVINDSDIIFLVIKKNVFKEVASTFDLATCANKQFISFMASTSKQEINSLLPEINITRAMPSIAIADRKGIIAYTKTTSQMQVKLFGSLGYAIEVDESDLEKYTALAACGLGFAAYILEAFTNAGVNMGLSYQDSLKAIAQTFTDAIAISNFTETVKMVATKGGATEQGINIFNENNIESIISKAINAAYQKASGK